MKTRPFSLLWSSVFVLTLLTEGGCSFKTIDAEETSAPLIEGNVLDVAAGQPIPGAIVAGHWTQRAPFSQDFCVHTEIATTDANGHYQMATWNGYNPTHVVSYRAGYTLVYEHLAFERKFARKVGRYSDLQEAFNGPKEERLEYLMTVARLFSCDSGGKSSRNTVPAFEALYAEALALKMPAEDLWTLRRIAALAAAVDEHLTWAEVEQNEKQFLKDHLPLPDYATVTPQPLKIVLVPAPKGANAGAALAAPRPAQVRPQSGVPSAQKSAP